MARLPIDLPEGFTSEVRFRQGYDTRDEPGGGAQGLTIVFILRGPEGGALTWELMTTLMHRPIRDLAWDIYAKHTPKRADSPGFDQTRTGRVPGFIAGAVSLHWPVKLADWWTGPAECNILPGGKMCYQAVGYSIGDHMLETLTAEGDNGVWRELLAVYNDWKAAKND